MKIKQLVTRSKDYNESFSRRFFLLGLVLLISGLSFYVIARPLVVSALFGIEPETLSGGLLGASGSLGYWDNFPSFIHVFVFSCLSLSFLKLSSRNVIVVAAFWMGVNILFELAQTRYLENSIFAVHGTFDPLDLMATMIGAACFAVVALFMLPRQYTGKRTYQSKVVMPAAILMLGVVSISASDYECGDSEYNYCPVYYEPVYMSYDELRNAITVTDQHPLTETGKIYLYGKYLLVNTPNQGVHIYDNSDRRHPIHRAYINVPGNLDIAVKNGYLYVDSYVDLVTIDIRDLSTISVVSRLIDVFPYNGYQNIPDGIALREVDPSKGVIVGYKEGAL